MTEHNYEIHYPLPMHWEEWPKMRQKRFKEYLRRQYTAVRVYEARSRPEDFDFYPNNYLCIDRVDWGGIQMELPY
jgi:hypothetical protein